MNKNLSRGPEQELASGSLGARLRVARETAGLTQADAASSIDVVRTTLVAIEKGQRRIRTDELQKLARRYHTSVNALLRHESVCIDLVPRFRKLSTVSNHATDSAARLLTGLVQAEVELENALGITRPRNDPPERPLMPGDVHAQAETNATELRHWLGLGLAPVRDLVSLLELDLGVRVYVRPLDSQVSGLFAYDEEVGAYMLVNANHPRARRAQTGGHELGHFSARRRKPDILHVNEREGSRRTLRERLCSRVPDAGTRHFISLVSGPANQTLDDGEAATIASALEYNATALIDERKAIRICAERFEELSTGCTVDIFTQDGVQRILGRDTLADAAFNALCQGRMRVPAPYVEWVVNLIGAERAAQCRSLPASVRSVESRRS